MNLSKRIALTSSVILVFFFFTIVVFMWSTQVSRDKVSKLQSVIRTQYLVSDISQQLKELNTRLKVLETVASAQDKNELDVAEQTNLLALKQARRRNRPSSSSFGMAARSVEMKLVLAGRVRNTSSVTAS